MTKRKFAFVFNLLLAACATGEPPTTQVETGAPFAEKTWQLVSFQSMDDSIGTTAPSDPSLYTMILRADGIAAFRLNCNRATATWSATPASDNSGRIEFGPSSMTRAACPPPSLDTKIARDLQYVRSYAIRDGNLYLSLMADGGIYAWKTSGQVSSRGPSFDCAAAKSSAEKIVCTNDRIAHLDRELARLFGLALEQPDLGPARQKELRAMQRGWIKGRDDCWKSTLGLESCVIEEYAFRIHDLRRSYAHARSDDNAGVSVGPLAYRCDGLDALISAMFINADPPMVSLNWRETWRTLTQARSGSGARYVNESYPDGAYQFWIKGDSALLNLPGQPDLSCTIEPTG
ncbi:MAG: MliC family protein [Rhodobacteraceae bacterium]|nr:MliC family protein [Paracoccaceae bacterium]